MPDVRNCRKCGKIFNYIGGAPICPACREKEEEDFQRVKKYLYENPGASLTQVSTELEISVEMIKRFLREGRLEIANDEGNLVLECENCGRSIKTGRFCPDCERNLASGFKSAASQMKLDLDSRSTSERKSLGLRYLNKEYEKGK
ncbi:MAG: flagellar protein [Acetivibrionales bacterium]|jgi:flagellar operon protein (TIGR03826 family)|nr:MerR family transcriptional regulator [Bacillota bacterium]HOA54351.1 MerR family transcriptional regulator [Clostridiales bacterium]HPZ04891.1 MerR family transcriptional regulator [Clostridiales bacterium]HQD31715.1 MerR family transcriptional regulator [Clostridiales bacterium]